VEIAMTDCDKCKTPVSPANDATLFEAIRSDDPFFAFAISRHLLPVVIDDVQVCPGSPSRAQYLEGQPRDSRYPYRDELERPSRDAYAALQAEYSLEGDEASAES